MIPIDLEANRSKVNVTVTFYMLTYRPNLVRIITKHRLDLGLSNLADMRLGMKMITIDFEVKGQGHSDLGSAGWLSGERVGLMTWWL